MSTVVTVIPVTVTAVVRRVNSVSTVSTAYGEGCVGSPNLGEALLNSNLTASVTSLFNTPTGAACNRGANILTLSGICSPQIIHVTTCFTIVFDLSPGFTTVVRSVPATIMNNVSFILCNVVSTVNIHGIIRTGISFSGTEGAVITTIVLIITLNLAGNVAFRINSSAVALATLTYTSVTNVILGLVFPRGSFSPRRTFGTSASSGRVGLRSSCNGGGIGGSTRWMVFIFWVFYSSVKRVHVQGIPFNGNFFTFVISFSMFHRGGPFLRTPTCFLLACVAGCIGVGGVVFQEFNGIYYRCLRGGHSYYLFNNGNGHKCYILWGRW